MQWSDYKLVYSSTKVDDPIVRYVRACSARDAKWRAARKFILPTDAVLTDVHRADQPPTDRQPMPAGGPLVEVPR